MSIIDKVIAVVTPPETAEERGNARMLAPASATPGSWLSMVLDHHEMIEDGFEEVRMATHLRRPGCHRPPYRSQSVIGM